MSVKNTATLRLANMALNHFGSYVASDFDSSKFETFKKLQSDECKKAALFSEDQSVCIVRGNKGSLARLCFVGKDGKTLAIRADGELHVINRDLLKIEVLCVTDFVKATIEKSSLIRLKVEETGAVIVGFSHGEISSLYASCVYALNNRVCFKDIETRKNDYNAKELVSLGGKISDEEKTALVSAITSARGVQWVKNEAKKKTGAKKLKNVSSKKALTDKKG